MTEEYCKSCKYFKQEYGELYNCACDNEHTSANKNVYSITCKKFIEDTEKVDIECVKNEIMPFGKYKNKKLKELDTDYLRWLKKQDWVKMPLKKYVYAYYEHLYHTGFNGISCDPYDICPFSIFNEVGYGELC
jgi:uncharacterized protein (DUF3820 family)